MEKLKRQEDASHALKKELATAQVEVLICDRLDNC